MGHQSDDCRKVYGSADARARDQRRHHIQDSRNGNDDDGCIITYDAHSACTPDRTSAPALDAETSLQGARLVVQPRVYHLGVSGRGALSDRRSSLTH